MRTAFDKDRDRQSGTESGGDRHCNRASPPGELPADDRSNHEEEIGRTTAP